MHIKAVIENEWHRKTFQSFRNYDNSQNINFVGMQIDKLMSESELIIYEEQSLARRKKNPQRLVPGKQLF